MTATIVLIMLLLFGKGLTQDNRAAWASYLVSLGIFGTFLGITVALLRFDPRAVEQSVPDLLSGMQIAFHLIGCGHLSFADAALEERFGNGAAGRPPREEPPATSTRS